MKTIIQFLKSQFDYHSEDSEKVEQTMKDINKLNQLFSSNSRTIYQTKHFKTQPRVHKNQIWTIKNEYEDFEGRIQKSSHPFIVLINSDLNDIEEEPFVRVLVISPFIEMASNSDEVCKDPSLIGFPFLVETWNDQPILAEILDEYVGYYELNPESILKTEVLELVTEPVTEYLKSEKISDIQRQFRDIEISRAKYINHSVVSLLTFLENRQSIDTGVVISLFDRSEYPKFFFGQNEIEPTLALAAKSGIDTEDKYLMFENERLPFKIFIRKNEDGFILSINSSEKMKLFQNLNVEISGTSYKEKSVFTNLKPGKFNLQVETIKQPIKIRLK